MNKCKFCQAEMADNGTFCPVCGRDNREEEIPVVTEPVPAEEIAAQEEAFVEEMPKPSAGKIGLAVAAIVVLVAVLIALLVGGMGKNEVVEEDVTVPATGEAVVEETAPPATIPADGNPDDVTCKGTYTASDEEVIAAADVVVATAGDFQLTNSELQIYYWLEVQSFLQQYGTYA